MNRQLTCRNCGVKSRLEDKQLFGWRRVWVTRNGNFGCGRNGIISQHAANVGQWLSSAVACGAFCVQALFHRFIHRGDFSPFPKPQHSSQSTMPRTIATTTQPISQTHIH